MRPWRMRKVNRLLTILLLSVACLPAWAANSFVLQDRAGNRVAYLDAERANTIFLSNGAPTAYVDGTSIYSFDGSHLGWMENGIIWNHEGEAIGLVKSAPALPASSSLWRNLPPRLMQDIEPLRPQFDATGWSDNLAKILAKRAAN